MDSEFLKEWEKFSLTEEENAIVGVEDGGNVKGDAVDQIRLAIVGKLCTVKPFNVEAMKRTLTSVWRLNDNIAIRTIESNLFVFQFFDVADKERILASCSWFFDEKLLLVKEMLGGEQPLEVEFLSSPMWVRLLDVPFNKRNSSVMYDIGEALESFLEFDDSNPLGWGEYMRIKVMTNVRKPLRRGVFIATEGKEVKWIDVKYERLADFCFYCGILDHTERDCLKKMEEGESKGEVVYQIWYVA
uniref:CCHC-type domain-containing protein n=1 Tax=Chenopodium quinoa TaxID=63459 RepID=A0A803MCJ0_CHEQI